MFLVKTNLQVQAVVNACGLMTPLGPNFSPPPAPLRQVPGVDILAPAAAVHLARPAVPRERHQPVGAESRRPAPVPRAAPPAQLGAEVRRRVPLRQTVSAPRGIWTVGRVGWGFWLAGRRLNKAVAEYVCMKVICNVLQSSEFKTMRPSLISI